MREDLIELLAQAGLTVLYSVGAVVTGFVGFMVEYQSFLHFNAGEYPLGVWLSMIGAVILFFTYLILTDKLLWRLALLTSPDTGDV